MTGASTWPGATPVRGHCGTWSDNMIIHFARGGLGEASRTPPTPSRRNGLRSGAVRRGGSSRSPTRRGAHDSGRSSGPARCHPRTGKASQSCGRLAGCAERLAAPASRAAARAGPRPLQLSSSTPRNLDAKLRDRVAAARRSRTPGCRRVEAPAPQSRMSLSFSRSSWCNGGPASAHHRGLEQALLLVEPDPATVCGGARQVADDSSPSPRIPYGAAGRRKLRHGASNSFAQCSSSPAPGTLMVIWKY